ncbi:hypothetical protein AB7179_08130 [Providencia manganoxydans]|uniref:Uncharacterized protein n=1 Tax=Providencia manganoxydans TaxID=2923283 RepID=A0ABX7AC08_9GAMM|nr:hypothetical protein JI723_14545 [Providencia manganoxydans]
MTTSISDHNKLAIYSSQLGQISKKNTEETKASIVNSINNASNSPIEKPQVEAAKQGKAHTGDLKQLNDNIKTLKNLVSEYQSNDKSLPLGWGTEKKGRLEKIQKNISNILKDIDNYALRIAGNETKAQARKAKQLSSDISTTKTLLSSIGEIDSKAKLGQQISNNEQKSRTEQYESKQLQKLLGRTQ